MFKFMKKDKGNVPPDVGREELENSASDRPVEDSEDVGTADVGEESEEESTNEEEHGEERAEEEQEKTPSKSKSKNNQQNFSSNVLDEKINLEFEKVRGKIEALGSLIKGYSERMAMLSQQIGEVRAMNLATEKSISKLDSQSAKAVDIVREVKPEKLRIDYQKMDMKVQELNERIEANKQFMDTVMNELKEIRRKIGTFLGTEELLRLNEDVKKDLIETQQMATRARLHSDKTEQLFSEMRRGMAESEKIDSKVNNLDVNYSGLRKEIEKLKIDFSKIVNQDEFSDFKKSVENKFSIVEYAAQNFDRIKSENERILVLVERIVAVSERNKKDIADIAMTIGDSHIKGVSDYDNRLASILKILDTLAGQISDIKKKNGGAKEKIKVERDKGEIMKKNKLHLKNIDVHPEISKGFTAPKNDISEKLKIIGNALDKEIDGIKKETRMIAKQNEDFDRKGEIEKKALRKIPEKKIAKKIVSAKPDVKPKLPKKIAGKTYTPEKKEERKNSEKENKKDNSKHYDKKIPEKKSDAPEKSKKKKPALEEKSDRKNSKQGNKPAPEKNAFKLDKSKKKKPAESGKKKLK